MRGGMLFRRMPCVIHCVETVCVRNVRVMSRLLVVACCVMLCRLCVVMRGMRVVISCVLMMIGCFL